MICWLNSILDLQKTVRFGLIFLSLLDTVCCSLCGCLFDFWLDGWRLAFWRGWEGVLDAGVYEVDGCEWEFDSGTFDGGDDVAGEEAAGSG
jgi:hypothetical protein